MGEWHIKQQFLQELTCPNIGKMSFTNPIEYISSPDYSVARRSPLTKKIRNIDFF